MCVCAQPLHGRAGNRDSTHAHYSTGTCLQRCAINSATVCKRALRRKSEKGSISTAARSCQTRASRAKYTRQCCHNVFPVEIKLSFSVKKAKMKRYLQREKQARPSGAVCARTES
eukprot:IDg21718t1